MIRRESKLSKQQLDTASTKAMNDYTIAALKKESARCRAEEAIYAHISKWADTEVVVGDAIPILQAHKASESLVATILGGVTEVRAVLDAATVLNKTELTRQLKSLVHLKGVAEEAQREIAEFDFGMMWKATNAGKNLHLSLEGRVINSVGASRAALLSLDIIAVGLEEQITEIRLKLDEHIGLGRAKDEAAYKVALHAAKLFANVLGEKPTYSEGSSGLSGKFTPFLKDIYIAFGWKKRSLRGPIEDAISNLKEQDYLPPRMGLLGYLNAAPRK